MMRSGSSHLTLSVLAFLPFAVCFGLELLLPFIAASCCTRSASLSSIYGLFSQQPGWVGMKAESEQTIEYLQSLQAIREECRRVYENINYSKYYRLDESRLNVVAEAIQLLIKTDHNNDPKQIKPHGRWRHIPDRYLEGLDGRQVVDLFTVSVLLDAGAGDNWKYQDQSGQQFSRSEGIAIAVAESFHKGLFSKDKKSRQVDSDGLINLTVHDLESIFQVSSSNPMTGVEGRVELMTRLGRQLEKSAVFNSSKRPSGMIDYIVEHSKNQLDVEWFWKNVIINAFNPVWPESTRCRIGGQCIGDVHYCELTERFVPFHKLSQWLCYSLLEPIETIFKISVVNSELQTGLAEYRNGGLFVDYQVILPLFDPATTTLEPSSEAVVEWRALTVHLLDRLHRTHFPTLTLAQLLEAGTWKAGRLIARQKRPTGAPPLHIQSDGTLF